MGAFAFVLCEVILPAIYNGWDQDYPDIMYLKIPFMIGLAATTIPFFIALWQTFKLLNYIDQSKAFSQQSIRALQTIKYCGIAFGALYAACLPIFYILAKREDAPGLMVIGLIMCFAPFVVAVFAAVLQKLLESGIAIKSENDLTV